MLRTVWGVRTHEVLEQGMPIVHRTAPRCGQAPYSRTSVTMQDLSRHFVGCQFNSPLIRQFLAKLHNAATGTIYVPPKYRRVHELRAQLTGIRLLFKKVRDVTNQYNKEQSRAKAQQLAMLQTQVRAAEKIFSRIPHATVTKAPSTKAPCKRVRWTKRPLVVHSLPPSERETVGDNCSDGWVSENRHVETSLQVLHGTPAET